MTIREAATAGRRALLEALRDRIAAELDMGVPARDLASLSRRLIEIERELDGIIAEEEGDDIGEAASTPDEDWPTL